MTVARDGGQRRVLLECKDFDVSSHRVGLGIVRDFFGVVEDTKPDEAIVLTCTRFTRDAKKYAQAKGIKLAVMRAFEDKDWEGRLRTVVVNWIIEGQPRIDKGDIDMDEANKAQFAADAGAVEGGFQMNGDLMVLVSGAIEEPFPDVLYRLSVEARRATGQRTVDVEIPADVWRLRVAGGSPITFRRFVVKVTFPPPDTMRQNQEHPDRRADPASRARPRPSDLRRSARRPDHWRGWPSLGNRFSAGLTQPGHPR